MGLSLTETIAKMFEDLIGGKWGRLTSKTYLKYCSIFNFGIVFVIGILIQTIFSGFGGMFGIVGILSGFLWDYVMTVGPMGYLWGFKLKPEKVVDDKKSDDKKTTNNEKTTEKSKKKSKKV